MSRTLGAIQQPSPIDDQIAQEPFYLTQQLPMFLANDQSQAQSGKFIKQDIAKCKQLIENLCDNQIKTRQSLEEIQQGLDQNESLNKGIGYFAAKNLVFVEYLMLLKVYELFKLNGKSLTSGSGLQLYKRLAYLKTLLLKLQPVQKKLEYQKTKILKHSDRAVVTKQQKTQQQDQEEVQDQNQQSQAVEEEQEGKIEEQQQEDEMAFKPRPAALMKVKQEKDTRIKQNDKYEAPKVSSALSKQDKFKQRMQRQKEIKKLGLIRRLQSDLIDDEAAQEKYLGDEINEKFKRKFQEKVSYEEEAFVRLPDTKKDKFYMKQMIRNNARKNQLEEDFKEVQMVKQLFDQENEMEHKMLHDKRKGKFSKNTNQQHEKTKTNKTKKISKQ